MTPEVVRAGVAGAPRPPRRRAASTSCSSTGGASSTRPGSTRCTRWRRLRDEGLIGAIGVTNFDAAHLAPRARRRHPARHQPGLLLARRPPRRRPARRALRPDRRPAPRLRHALRRLPRRPLARRRRARGDPRLEPVEVQALHRRRRRLGILPGHPRRRRRGRPQARRLDLQRRDPLGARAAGGRGDHRRRPHHRERAPRRQRSALFGFALDDEDRERLDAAFAATTPIPGDCGDEYRKPPFLTASGDLSHHLDALPQRLRGRAGAGPARAAARLLGQRLGGAGRLLRAPCGIGDRILVSGTTATHGADRVRGARRRRRRRRPTSSTRSPPRSGRSAAASRTSSARGSTSATSPTGSRCPAPTAAVFGAIRPANTLVAVAGLVGDYEVEIEAEAIVAGEQADRSDCLQPGRALLAPVQSALERVARAAEGGARRPKGGTARPAGLGAEWPAPGRAGARGSRRTIREGSAAVASPSDGGQDRDLAYMVPRRRRAQCRCLSLSGLRIT